MTGKTKLSEYEHQELTEAVERLEAVASLGRANFPESNTGVTVSTDGADPHASASLSASQMEDE